MLKTSDLDGYIKMYRFNVFFFYSSVFDLFLLFLKF